MSCSFHVQSHVQNHVTSTQLAGPSNPAGGDEHKAAMTASVSGVCANILGSGAGAWKHVVHQPLLEDLLTSTPDSDPRDSPTTGSRQHNAQAQLSTSGTAARLCFAFGSSSFGSHGNKTALTSPQESGMSSAAGSSDMAAQGPLGSASDTSLISSDTEDTGYCDKLDDGTITFSPDVATTMRLLDGGSRNLRDRSNRKPVQDRIRQKRQTLQDMTRPLKHWLYHHRDNPYPSKSEKLTLARNSQMTLTQVSNWFANARRRLKNTVRGPEMTWAKRIKLYNNFVEGNQELLSVGSSSSMSDDDILCDVDADLSSRGGEEQQMEMPPLQTSQDMMSPRISDHSSALASEAEGTPERGTNHTAGSLDLPDSIQGTNSTTAASPLSSLPTPPPHDPPTPQGFQPLSPPARLPSTSADPEHEPEVDLLSAGLPQGVGSPSGKYKQNIMQRYLQDAHVYQTALQQLLSSSPERGDHKEKERHRNPSGSLSSHDYEEYMSSASSSRSTPTREHQENHIDEYEEFSRHWPDIKSRAEDDLYWKEISAALALTSLARSHYPVSQ